MKKLMLILVLAATLGISMFVFAACSGTVAIESAAWAETETLTYSISQSDTVVGTYVAKIERLEAGKDYTLEKVRAEAFTITSGMMRGFRYTQTVTDTAGNLVMESESIVNGFNALASYKRYYENDLNDKAVEIKSYVDGKHYRYWIDGTEQKKIKTKNNATDNEVLYAAIRVYSNINTGYTKSTRVVDPLTGSIEDISISATTTREQFTVNYTTPAGENLSKSASCIVTYIAKTGTPVGDSIKVLYTDETFKLDGSRNTSVTNSSYHIPVKMIENNLTYTLTHAAAY